MYLHRIQVDNDHNTASDIIWSTNVFDTPEFTALILKFLTQVLNSLFAKALNDANKFIRMKKIKILNIFLIIIVEQY